ncbi:phage protein NinX family protein [Burkholderia ubonensis]|uniref:DUF2591 domain-containing protein n=1 Tax=Burkholderia ubonensis TaxID=101571 RepID=A0ABD4E0A9_9BURK|nr:phage protein NinX family protein [Burkholderia ubonensis]KVN83445.1 hypothetical protein WJ68_16155 [Burkholderia ubonensis]
MKASELTGAQLDYWVARVLGDRHVRIVGEEEHERCETRFSDQWPWDRFMPSRAWMISGPLVERFKLSLDYRPTINEWAAGCRRLDDGLISTGFGETAPIAVCRAIVIACIGDDVQFDTESAPA